MSRRGVCGAMLLRWAFFAILSTRYLAVSAPANGLDCADDETAPWMVACQADLTPTERWIYANHGQFLEINGHLMHYVDIGGDSANASDRVYVFLHGQPTWGYLWRNIAKFIGGCKNDDFPEFENACNGPDIESITRALIIDYIGFGRSAKPAIQFDDSGMTAFDYSISSHVDQLEGLLDALGLGIDNGGPGIVLVAHDAAGSIGLGYIGRRPENVIGHVCIECYLLNLPLETFLDPRVSPGVGCCGALDQLSTIQAWNWVFETHAFVIFMSNVINRNLTDAESKFYSFPFNSPSDRWGSFSFPQQLVFGDAVFANGTILSQKDPVPSSRENLPLDMVLPIPSGVWFEMQRGRNVLFNTPISKLLLVSTPGFVFAPNSTDLKMYVDFASTFPESFTGPINVGRSIHYIPEEEPMNIANEIVRWDSKVFR